MVKILGSPLFIKIYQTLLKICVVKTCGYKGFWDRLKTTVWSLKPKQMKKTSQETGVKSLFLGSKGCVFKTTTLEPSDWGH